MEPSQVQRPSPKRLSLNPQRKSRRSPNLPSPHLQLNLQSPPLRSHRHPSRLRLLPSQVGPSLRHPDPSPVVPNHPQPNLVGPSRVVAATIHSDWHQSVKTPAPVDPAKVAEAHVPVVRDPATTPSHPGRGCAVENVAGIVAQQDRAQVHGQAPHALPALKVAAQRHHVRERPSRL